MADNTRQRNKHADPDQASLLNELRALGAKMDLMQTKTDNMQVTMQMQMDVKINDLRGSLEKVISDGQAAFKRELEKAVREMRQNLDLEVSIMSSRMENIETKMDKNLARGKPFDPDVSLVIIGLPQTEDEDVEAQVKHLLCEGLRCEPVPKLVAVERGVVTQGSLKWSWRWYRTKWRCYGERLNSKTATAMEECLYRQRSHTRSD